MHPTQGLGVQDTGQNWSIWAFRVESPAYPFSCGGGSWGIWLLGAWPLAPSPLPSLPRFSQQQSFVQILQEVNDFAGQRELVAENLSIRVCLELAKYSQEMKQERKMVSGPCPGVFGGSLLQPR